MTEHVCHDDDHKGGDKPGWKDKICGALIAVLFLYGAYKYGAYKLVTWLWQ